MTNRRDFIKQIAALGVVSSIDLMAFSKQMALNNNNKMIWANLVHLSTNMWEDHPYVKDHAYIKERSDIDKNNIHKDDFECKTCLEALMWGMRAYRSFLTFDQAVWDALLNHMADSGMNMVIIDLGDGVQYESHPEIAVKNAWPIDKLKSELYKIRKLGIEPIPKLNFAATHDAWLGEYARMVSTRKYYEVCRDLIREVIDLFDTPRFFHIGMDEETAKHQINKQYAVLRQHDLWWNDLYFYINEIESKGVRSWVWSDFGWYNPEVFFEKMPKSVLQSNWYYGSRFDLSEMEDSSKIYLGFYDKLNEYGYNQIPTGSNFTNDSNIGGLVKYCKENINNENLLGFMMTSWLPTLTSCSEKLLNAVNLMAKAKSQFY